MGKPSISFETERLFIRPVVKEDKDAYMNLRVPASDISTAYSMIHGFRDRIWERELNYDNGTYVIAFQKKDNELVAVGSFQNLNTDTVEIGFEVAEKHRNKGIATELLKGMLKTVKDVFPGKAVRIRTSVTNTACRRVAEKCGGILSDHEYGPAADALASLLASAEKRLPEDDEELQRLRKSITEFIKENKEGVCVYRFDPKG